MKKKFTIKGLLATTLAFVMALSLGTTALANDLDSSPAPKELTLPKTGVSAQNIRSYNTGQATEITITDKAAIEEYIRLNNVEVPEGATLTEVIITSNADNTNDVSNNVSRATPVGINIKNVKISSGDYVYNDEAEWDKISNNSPTQTDEFSTSYTQTKTSSWNVGVKGSGKIKVVELEVAVGFTLANLVSNTKSFKATIPPKKRIEVKVQTNYTLKTYDVYDGSTYLDSGKAWNPKGLIIEKFEYSL